MEQSLDYSLKLYIEVMEVAKQTSILVVRAVLVMERDMGILLSIRMITLSIFAILHRNMMTILLMISRILCTHIGSNTVLRTFRPAR